VNQYWDIPVEWSGATAFVMASGPSVLSIDCERLRGQHVIAINTSFRVVPFAEYLIFADSRWWQHHRHELQTAFPGRIISCSVSERDQRLLRLRRTGMLSDARDAVMLMATTTTGALELAAKLGAVRIVVLGLDGGVGPDGRIHHHKAHPWPILQGWQARHRADLVKIAGPLKARGVEVLLGTPGSAYADLWPTVKLADMLGAERAAA
jgi:hypothetical protein